MLLQVWVDGVSIVGAGAAAALANGRANAIRNSLIRFGAPTDRLVIGPSNTGGATINSTITVITPPVTIQRRLFPEIRFFQRRYTGARKGLFKNR